DINKDEYIDALYSSMTEGKIYGVPHGTNPIALAYNKKIFTEAGVPYPTDEWTYQDLLDTAEKLTKVNGDNVEHYGYISGKNIVSGWLPWIRATGGQVLDATLTKAMVNDPKSIEGITKWSDAAKSGIFAPHSFEKSLGGAEQVFGQEKAAMYYVQYSTQLYFQSEFPDLDWDTVMIPKNFDGTRTVPMVTNSWLVYSKASEEKKEAAWTFLKYYLSEESQDILAASGASLPVLKSSLVKVDAMTDTKPSNKKAYTMGIAEGGATLDENATWEEWNGVAQPLFDEIYNNRLTVEKGADEITEKIQAVLDRK
ncbi:MAG TPA: extracellular solute-binding protein, partial [Candidatus Paenibacillus intestinavium]|nr:extracellular solute-binding protein [Candidatus Paenibacillus intestinavium]